MIEIRSTSKCMLNEVIMWNNRVGGLHLNELRLVKVVFEVLDNTYPTNEVTLGGKKG